MRERPILFSGEMVRAILDGRKSQTRRVVKPQPHIARDRFPTTAETMRPDMLSTNVCFAIRESVGTTRMLGAENFAREFCPLGVIGDRLWVRETYSLNHSIHYAHDNGRGTTGMLYRASWPKETDDYGRAFEGGRRWRPSIHMPRWASRITLEITGVRVKRVQDISGEDVEAEGIRVPAYPPVLRVKFADLWDSINAKRGYGWDANPWVWVIEFKRVAENGA